MTTCGAANDMCVHIESLFTTGALSDLTILCGGQKFPVLYTQSAYFRKLFTGPWKEANTTTLELPDDDPYVLRVLIRYFYKHFLDTSFFDFSAFQHKTSAGSPFLIQVYAIADKYDVPHLRSLVVQRLAATCDPLKDETDFIEALRVIDDFTAENTVWEIFLPKVKANLQVLLRSEAFEELVVEQSALSLRLLGFLAASSQAMPAK